MTVSQLVPRLLQLAGRILNPAVESKPLIVADNEHLSQEILEFVSTQTPFDLLIPMSRTKFRDAEFAAIPQANFQTHWAGYATTHRPYKLKRSPDADYCQLIQRSGEGNDIVYNAFLSTRYRNEVEDLCIHFPQRWHIEEFFNAYQDLGWKRAGTMNLNVRIGQMSMALLAQAACDQLRKRLGDPFTSWDSKHFASAIFRGIDGDIRVADNTIIVTLYNPPAPDLLRSHYENLPKILEHENVDPRIPWLFDYKLDFRFK
jgi:hypothetical protein